MQARRKERGRQWAAANNRRLRIGSDVQVGEVRSRRAELTHKSQLWPRRTDRHTHTHSDLASLPSILYIMYIFVADYSILSCGVDKFHKHTIKSDTY